MTTQQNEKSGRYPDDDAVSHWVQRSLAQPQSDELRVQWRRLKEAGPSILEPYRKKRTYHQHAERIVVGQRLVQATSDMFLGWHTSGLSTLDYDWRQLKDMKGSADIAQLDKSSYEAYLKLCTWCLARAHARTGDPTATSGCLGSGDSFVRATGSLQPKLACRLRLVRIPGTGR